MRHGKDDNEGAAKTRMRHGEDDDEVARQRELELAATRAGKKRERDLSPSSDHGSKQPWAESVVDESELPEPNTTVEHAYDGMSAEEMARALALMNTLPQPGPRPGPNTQQPVQSPERTGTKPKSRRKKSKPAKGDPRGWAGYNVSNNSWGLTSQMVKEETQHLKITVPGAKAAVTALDQHLDEWRPVNALLRLWDDINSDQMKSHRGFRNEVEQLPTDEIVQRMRDDDESQFRVRVDRYCAQHELARMYDDRDLLLENYQQWTGQAIGNITLFYEMLCASDRSESMEEWRHFKLNDHRGAQSIINEWKLRLVAARTLDKWVGDLGAPIFLLFPQYYTSTHMKTASQFGTSLLRRLLSSEDEAHARVMQGFCNRLAERLNPICEDDGWSDLSIEEIVELVKTGLRHMVRMDGFLYFSALDKYKLEPASRVQELVKVWPPAIDNKAYRLSFDFGNFGIEEFESLLPGREPAPVVVTLLSLLMRQVDGVDTIANGRHMLAAIAWDMLVETFAETAVSWNLRGA